MMNTFLLFLFLGFSCVFIAECALNYQNALKVYKRVCGEDKKIRDKYMKCFSDTLSEQAVEIIKKATNTKSLLEATDQLCDDAIMIAKVCDSLMKKRDEMRFDYDKDGPKMLRCLLE